MMDETREIRIASEAPEKESHWYLLTGLLIGLILGLVYAWLINPVVYAYTQPDTLKDNYKDVYRSTIAQAYAATGNLERAALRLALLGEDDPVFALGAQAQRSLAEGDQEKARSLALLASALQIEESSPVDLPHITPAEVTTTPTINLIPTQTLPAITPMP